MMDLLRFSTAGSVDDGKSTLIGRLLFDTKGAYEDQLASIHKDGQIDLSLLTDGLRAEREQGITIDVAYRYFATPKRKFIIADTPGHEQYTRNMVTGASTAEVAIVLIDARKGVLPQSRRHAYISSLLGISRVAVAVNKMDLVGFSEDTYRAIEHKFTEFAAGLGFREIRFFPISALAGDNVVEPSQRTPWFDGGSLLHYLETVPGAAEVDREAFRLPVQYVIRPTLDFRGYAGQIAAGTLQPGDPVLVLPSGRITQVQSISSLNGDLEAAYAPMSVNVTLADEIDISRGDMLVSPQQPPLVGQLIEASLVWMDTNPLRIGRSYLVKHTTRQIRASVVAIDYKIDINSLEHIPANELYLNEIAVVRLEAQRPLFFDPYRVNRITGSFILIDALSNATVAAGMIRGLARDDQHWRPVTSHERWERRGHKPALVSVPSKGDLAQELERILFDRGIQVAIADQTQAAATLVSAGLVVILRTGSADLDVTVESLVQKLEADGVIPPASLNIGEGI